MSACTGSGLGASYWRSQEVPVQVSGLVSFNVPVPILVNAIRAGFEKNPSTVIGPDYLQS